jgi:hypothetical protein
MNMLTLLNAAPDTGNQGVSALCHAAVAGLASRGTDPKYVTNQLRKQFVISQQQPLTLNLFERDRNSPPMTRPFLVE